MSRHRHHPTYEPARLAALVERREVAGEVRALRTENRERRKREAELRERIAELETTLAAVKGDITVANNTARIARIEREHWLQRCKAARARVAELEAAIAEQEVANV